MAARPLSFRGKALVRILLLVAAAAAVAALASSFGIAYDYGYLNASILSGVEGGRYYELGSRLADRARREHGSLKVVPTAGSLENVARLSAAKNRCVEQFALVQDGTPVPESSRLVMLGRLPDPESLLLLKRRGQTFAGIEGVRGARIGIGPQGSGTNFLMRQLFEDPDLRDLGVQLSPHELSEQAALVAQGRLDLAAIVMQEDATFLRTVIRENDLDLAAPQNYEGLLARHPWLGLGHISAGRFDLVRPVPERDTPVARVDTFVVANSCAKRAERVALLMLLSAELPGFVRANPPRSTGAETTLPLAEEARQFFITGEPELADRYFPWLVNLMSPAYWVYLVMAATVFDRVIIGYSRFRLWRIDSTREKIERRIRQLTGLDLTHAEMRTFVPDGVLAAPEDRAAARGLLDELSDLRARCQKQTSSLVTPMGDEMYYRFQETLIGEATTTLSALLRKSDAPAETRA
jgi:uncharacterized protein